MANDKKMEKPLIFADDDATRFSPDNVRHADPSRIPGYSEVVQANDVAKADELRFRTQHAGKLKQEDVYKSIGADPKALDVEYQWLRITGPGGGDSYTANVELDKAVQQGFRKANRSVLEHFGHGFPPAAHEEADGTIRRMDVALYYRSGEVARKWERYYAEESAKREGARTESFRDGAFSAPVVETERSREFVELSH